MRDKIITTVDASTTIFAPMRPNRGRGQQIGRVGAGNHFPTALLFPAITSRSVCHFLFLFLFPSAIGENQKGNDGRTHGNRRDPAAYKSGTLIASGGHVKRREGNDRYRRRQSKGDAPDQSCV